MPVFWHLTSDLWFLDSVKRVLAAVEAPVVPAMRVGAAQAMLVGCCTGLATDAVPSERGVGSPDIWYPASVICLHDRVCSYE